MNYFYNDLLNISQSFRLLCDKLCAKYFNKFNEQVDQIFQKEIVNNETSKTSMQPSFKDIFTDDSAVSNGPGFQVDY